MHRSGTSVITRVLGLLGGQLPENLMLPNPANEQGYWESMDLYSIHEELLSRAGTSWDDVLRFPEPWFASEEAKDFQQRILAVLHREFGTAQLFVIKDPRISRLVPLWLAVLRQFESEPGFVLPLRHPLEVAASLRTRDGLPKADSLLLWLRHLVEAEKATRGQRRSFVSYEALLADWRKEIKRIGRDLEISWPELTSERSIEIDAFLSTSLRHHEYSEKELDTCPEIGQWVKRIYHAAMRAARGSSGGFQREFDAVRREIENSDTIYRPIITNLRAEVSEEIRKSDQQIASLNEAMAERGEQIARLNQALAERDKKISELNAILQIREAELEVVNARTRELEAAVTSREAEARELMSKLQAQEARASELDARLETRDTELEAAKVRTRELEAAVTSREAEARELMSKLQAQEARASELEAQLSAVYASHSWRVTAPMRTMSRGFSRLLRYARDAFKLAWRLGTAPLRRATTALLPYYRRYVPLRVRIMVPDRLRWALKGWLTASSLSQPRSEIATCSPEVGWEEVKEDLQLEGLFDEDLYLSVNPDLSRGIRDGWLRSGKEHFFKHGRYEVPSNEWRVFRFRLNGAVFDFDERAYLVDNPDVPVLISRGTYANGLDHFLHTGYHQCRDGLRALYAPHRFVKILGLEDGVAPFHPEKRYLTLFSHYDRDGLIDEYVLIYLDTLRNAGADICFITATDDPQELCKIRDRVFKIVIKNDAGRDFGSWYLALKALGQDSYADYDYLVFVNDSVYFPVCDPTYFFDHMRAVKLNMWGVTDSYELEQYHIQSFFVALDRKGREMVVPDFIRQYEAIAYMTKAGQIFSLEAGLTKTAMEARLSVGAYCSIQDIREDVIRRHELAPWRRILQLGLGNVNPTQRLWDLLIKHYGCPALKIELLRDNPLCVETNGWERIVDRRFMDPAVIQSHLKRAKMPPQLVSRAPLIDIRPMVDQVKLQQWIEGCGFRKGKRLVLLAHYDPDGLVDAHVETSIRSLHNSDSDVVLITSSTKVQEIRKMRPLCATILVKNDVARDFGSWYVACKTLQGQFADYDNVVWMNDSAYFPLFDPQEMFSSMEREGGPDFWGVVDSYNVCWHIMSWFWSFNRKIIEQGFVDWYLREFDPSFSKWDQIRNFEMRVPLMLRKTGYSARSYIAADDVFDYVSIHEREHERFSGRRDFSMTHDFWNIIIRQFRCPALKVELLRDNPHGLELKNVLDFVRRETIYDPEIIRRHVSRVKTGHLEALGQHSQHSVTADPVETTFR
jgi:lipopolysaccharide biosynthesis protein